MQGPTRENWRTVFNLALWSLRDRGKFNHLANSSDPAGPVTLRLSVLFSLIAPMAIFRWL